MNTAGRKSEQMTGSEARQVGLNVDAPEKPDEPLSVDKAQTRGQIGEPPQEAAQEKRDEKLDLWMQNVKEFIRNIDVKSL